MTWAFSLKCSPSPQPSPIKGEEALRRVIRLSLRGAQRRGNLAKVPDLVGTDTFTVSNEIANPRIEYGVAMT